MKCRLMFLLMIFVFCLCSTSYGYILVYKLSTTVKAVDTLTDVAEVIKFKGYLVIDYNDTEELVVDADVVMYGKDKDDTLACFRLDDEEELAIHYSVEANNVWVDFHQGGNRSGIEVIVTGKPKLKDIGLDEDKLVASKLKGAFMVWEEIFLDIEWTVLKGTGMVSASLNSGLTNGANETGHSSNTLADAIIAELVFDGYADVTP